MTQDVSLATFYEKSQLSLPPLKTIFQCEGIVMFKIFYWLCSSYIALLLKIAMKTMMPFLLYTITAFLSIRQSSCSVWEDMSIDGVSADTGYPATVLDYIYVSYYNDVRFFL